MVFRQMKDSILHLKAYTLFAQQSWGKTLLYLFLFTLLFGTIDSVNNTKSFYSVLPRILPVMEKIDFNVSEGKMNITFNTPLVVEDKGLLMLMYNPELFDALNKPTAGEYPPDHLSAARPAVLIFFILSLQAFFIGKLVSSSILCFISLYLSHMQKISLSIGALFKICLYTLTLPSIIQILKNIVLPNLPYFNFFYYSLAIIYLWLAIKAVKAEIAITPPDKPILLGN